MYSRHVSVREYVRTFRGTRVFRALIWLIRFGLVRSDPVRLSSSFSSFMSRYCSLIKNVLNVLHGMVIHLETIS